MIVFFHRHQSALRRLSFLLLAAVLGLLLIAQIAAFAAARIFSYAMNRQHMLRGHISVEKISADLLTMIANRRAVHIMVGFSTRLFAGVNAISPRLADYILLNRYSAILKKHLIDKNPAPPPPAAWMFPLGIGLVILSTLLYGGLIALPFFSIPTTTKLAATPLLIFFGEAAFWVGGALLGKEIVTRYKQYLNPCNWFCKPSAGQS